jgi:hypothetical protein
VSALAGIVAVMAAAAPAPVTLTIRYANGPHATEKVAHLRCRTSARADGFLRTSAGPACRRARKIAGFLASRPSPTRVCSQIYGGPERARIAGTIGERRIDRRFTRTNGCETADWRHAIPLLPRAHAPLLP